MKNTALLQSLLTLLAAAGILWLAKGFLIPLAYAFLIAISLFPLTRFLERKGMGNVLSILLPLLLITILFGGLLALLGYEMALLSGNWPLLQEKMAPFFDEVHAGLEKEFGWTAEEQNTWIRENIEKMSENAGALLKSTAAATFEAVFNLIIIPIYVALLLAYRRKLVNFLNDIVPDTFREKLPEVLDDTIAIFGRFIRGMVVVYIAVGLLNTLGLWIVGVENPLVYGMLTAIMTIIPYFGIAISALLPITISWLETGQMWQPLGIIAVFSAVQYLEANLIFPYVVGRYVNINTLAAIIAIFLGALIWGVAGMILFLPFLAVFRIFAAHFPQLKPWSRVLGS
jgi:predicted PurR-regulated permease PerM